MKFVKVLRRMVRNSDLSVEALRGVMQNSDLSVEVLRRMVQNSDQSILTLGQSNKSLGDQLQLINQRLAEIAELQRAQLVMLRDQGEAVDNLVSAMRESLLTSQRTAGVAPATLQSGGERMLES